jgi:5-methylcytosine-specific restriction enzyme A
MPARFRTLTAERAAGLVKPSAKVRDERRLSSHERGYDWRWRKASRAYRVEHPLCECCKANGVLRPSEVVDHIIPHNGDQRLFWDVTNRQALCKALCHDSIKAALELKWERGEIGTEELRLARPLGPLYPQGGHQIS